MDVESEQEVQRLRQALNEAQLALDMLSDKMLDGWVRLAPYDDLRIICASPSYYRLTGYTWQESQFAPINGRGINLIVPEDRPAVTNALQRLALFGESVCTPFRLRRKDGSISWKLACGTPMRQIDGEAVVDIYLQDTTASQIAQQELTKLINNIPSAIVRVEIGHGHKIRFANDTFYQQIGYSPEAFAGGDIKGNYLHLVHPDDRVTLVNKALQNTTPLQDQYTLRYRIITGTGETRWMNSRILRSNDFRSNQPTFLCIITDITAEQEQQLQHALNEERYRIISEHTRDTVFEWNLITDMVQFSPMYEKMFGFPPPPDLPISALTQSDIIHEDDKALVDQMIQNIYSGQAYAEAIYRAKCADGSYLWCRNCITVIFDIDHRPLHAIGMLSDIDEFMRQAATLKQLATCDSLTGLLNRGAMEETVMQHLLAEPDTPHAFIQFDIDHFKQINDFMGHIAGDAALQKISVLLGENFLPPAAISRMGGDEFAIFLPAITSAEAVCSCAAMLCSIIHGDLHAGEKIYPLSVSVGVALYPEHGRTYLELYQHADAALYYAKAHGGDQYHLYTS